MVELVNAVRTCKDARLFFQKKYQRTVDGGVQEWDLGVHQGLSEHLDSFSCM